MNLSDYKEEKPHHLKRLFWYVINATIFRLMLGRATKQLRHSLLKLFGAEIIKDAYIYSSATIFAPWNLKVGRVCIGPNTILYNKDLIVIGDDSVISQGTYLCTASHDISSKMLPLNTAPIIIGKNVWVAADAFVGMGVTIGEGAVVGARAAVFKDVEPWTVVGGNPAKFIKNHKTYNMQNICNLQRGRQILSSTSIITNERRISA